MCRTHTESSNQNLIDYTACETPWKILAYQLEGYGQGLR